MHPHENQKPLLIFSLLFGITGVLACLFFGLLIYVLQHNDYKFQNILGEQITSYPEEFHKVVDIVDGDTIKVEINGEIKTIRLIGIDTPETVDPRKEVQCFGVEASNKTKEILSNKFVRLEADSTQENEDRYGRLLRYVFLQNGINFNLQLIQEGYAHEYTYKVPYKYQKEFKSTEENARKNQVGLWGVGCDL